MPTLSNALTHAILKLALSVTQGRNYRALLQASKTPGETQAALLKHILATNAGTNFGRRHDFSQIGKFDEYRRAVPVQTYEDLCPLIARQERTGEPCLTRERPIYYHRTSGTVGAPKDIPVTPAGIERVKQHQNIFAYTVSKGSQALAGKLFGISGQAVEGTMPGGTPYGSASGLLYQNQSKLVHSRYVLPAEISGIEDYQARYLAMAVYGLSEPCLSG